MKNFIWINTALGNEDAGTTGSLNLLLGLLAEETGLNNDGLVGNGSLSKNLSISSFQRINDGDGVTLGLGGGQAPQLLQVDDGAVVHVTGVMEVTHTKFAEESGMEAIKVVAVVSFTSSLTATSWMLAMLADTTVTGRYVTTELPRLFQSRHLGD
jgi:hypothetical protein